MQLKYGCKLGGGGMSRRDKAVARLMALPKDYTWEEAVALLKSLDFDVYTNDGSRVKFFRERDQAVISLHKPHPRNTMKSYMVTMIRDKLREWGDLDG
jgi:hypothetical protein